MRNTTTINEFWKDTYKTGSPIPFIITAQIVVFVILHLFKLLFDVELIHTSVFTWSIEKASLPASFERFILQPWSIVSYPLIYTSIFSLLFDCLWLYFIGNTFLNLLNRRQFWMLYAGAVLLGAFFYLIANQLPKIANNSAYLSASTLPLAAIMTATATLTPKSEIRLFIVGNVKLYILVAIYLGFQILSNVVQSPAMSISLILVIFLGYFFIQALQNGNDWSRMFIKNKKSRLKVVQHSDSRNNQHKNNPSLSNQEMIDNILDKISDKGYESLTSHEKEALFKASKED